MVADPAGRPHGKGVANDPLDDFLADFDDEYQKVPLDRPNLDPETQDDQLMERAA